MTASYNQVLKNGDKLSQAVVDLTAALASHAASTAEALDMPFDEEILQTAFPELKAAAQAVTAWKAGVT